MKWRQPIREELRGDAAGDKSTEDSSLDNEHPNLPAILQKIAGKRAKIFSFCPCALLRPKTPVRKGEKADKYRRGIKLGLRAN
ncbi:MAG: hypothetical protein H9847_04285 [Candidatus Anaerobiospirillum pullicola]|uniref:Uncharacterized protein n=1 Tax=Candidatus Anaerobiospirillum pullicola TaxID=2838451 RepID=A0A948X163_9GAMM|nr:hypothetical protein [Candidatus Anaerobiospirillum pullicola]